MRNFVRPSELGMCLLLLPLFPHILDRTTVGSRFSLAASSSSLLPEAPPSTFSYEANADPAAAETGSLKILVIIWLSDHTFEYVAA